MTMGAALIVLDTRQMDDFASLIAAAVERGLNTLYVQVTGPQASGPCTDSTLQLLAQLYEVVGAADPQLDAVPLFSCASWTTVALAVGGSVVEKEKLGRPAAEDAKQSEALAFQSVAVGGTFDRLHAGHRLLLAATALVSTREVYIGITDDQLLKCKRHKELVTPYAERAAYARAFVHAVKPGLLVADGPLTDPKLPTKAEYDPDVEALVVSEETVPGAEAINAARQAKGFAPLRIVTVPLVGKAVEGGKLSSTALRELESKRSSQ